MSSSKAPSFTTNTTDGINTISNANNIVRRQTNNLIGTSTPIKQKQRDPLDKWINSSLEDGDVFLHRKADYIIGQIQSKSNSTITRPDFPFIDVKKALIKREFINLLKQDVVPPKRTNWKLVKSIMKDFKSFQQMLQNRIIIGLNNQVGPSVAGSSIINGLNTNVSASGAGTGAGINTATSAGINTATSAGSGNNVGPSVAGNRMNNGLNTATSAGTGAGIGNNGSNTATSAGTGNNGNQLVGSGFVGTGAATSGAGNNGSVGGADASINSGTESRTESDSDGASSSSSYYSDYSDYERRRAQRRRRERRKRRERRREKTRRGGRRRGGRRRGGRRRERSYGSRSRSRGYNRYRHR